MKPNRVLLYASLITCLKSLQFHFRSSNWAKIRFSSAFLAVNFFLPFFCISNVFIMHMLHFEQKSVYGVEYPFNWDHRAPQVCLNQSWFAFYRCTINTSSLIKRHHFSHDGGLWWVHFDPPIVLGSSCFLSGPPRFKFDTTPRSHLVRPKDTVDPAKQDGIVYRIPCDCRQSTSGKQRDLCKRGPKDMTGI